MGFIFNQNSGETPDTLAQKRKIAEALMQQGMDTSPIQSWTQGAARIAQALSGNWARARADREEGKGRSAASSQFSDIVGALYGGNKPSASGGASFAPAGDMSKGAQIASMLQKDLGLTPAAAAGLAGNLAHESGNFKTLQEINPTVPGSKGGYGWGQWTGPRRRAFEQFAAQNKLDPTSDEANYGFLKHELTNTPEGAVLARLKGVNDPAQAAQIVAQYYERPGVPHMSSRINYAQQIAGQGGAPAPAQQPMQQASGPTGGTVQPAGYSPGAAQQGGQLPMAQIIELMGNPYLNEGQQGILAQIVKQKMADGQMTEKDMLDLEQARLTNEKLKAEIEKTRTGKGESSKRGLNLMYWQDKDGGLHAGQLSEGGGIEEVPLPEGGQWAPGVGFLDTGTGFVPYNKRTGVIPQPAIGGQPPANGEQPPAAVPGGGVEVPKNLAEAETAKSLGKDRGDKIALYNSISSKMPGLEQIVSELDDLAGRATYTLTGQASNALRREFGMKPGDSAVARAEYQAKVANQILPLLRDTFGAQFTQVEGEKLVATLGDPNLSPEEKQAQLKAFIEQKRRDLDALGMEIGASQPRSAEGKTSATGQPSLEDILKKY